MVDFGNRLKDLRKRYNFTQQELANKLKVTKSVVSYYELQERTPSPEILVKLATIFHTTTDYLLGLEKKELLDISGLSDNNLKTIISLIESLRNK